MGKLLIVPTPIGNLEDITLRAIRVLKEANLILAEDTRTSRKLLQHYGIETPMQSHHMHNEHKTVSGLAARLEGDETIVLITDAGTPSISDPGFLLTRTCLEKGIQVECLPGATAFIPALVISGLPNDRFLFEGFLPIKKGRQTRLNELADEKRTMIFYESPHKILKTLEQFISFFGAARPASVSRELTKIYEETVRGTLAEIHEHFSNQPPRGEFVIIVGGHP